MKKKLDRVQKMITFPRAMYDVLEQNAKKVGLNTPEYVRYIVLNDIKSMPSYDLDKINSVINEAMSDLKSNKVKKVKNSKELEMYFRDLEKSI